MVNRDLEFYVETLHEHAFFSNFTPEEISLIKSQSVIHQYRKGQVLFFQSDPRLHSFYILKGLIRLEKTDYSGEHHYLDYIKANSFFPYGGLLSDQTYTHSAYAATDIDLLHIPNALMSQLVSNNNRQLQYMYQQLAKNLQFQEWRIQQTMNSSAYERVTQALALWMHDMGTSVADEVVIEYPLTINELATIAGTTRETAGKVVRDLTQDKRIEFTRRNVRFLTPEYFSGAQW